MRADVLVTHAAPSVHRHGFEALDLLATALGEHTTFHDHHHDSIDYSPQWERLVYKACGVSFCGITALNGNVLRIGDYEMARRR